MFGNHVNNPVLYCEQLEAYHETPIVKDIIQAHKRIIVQRLKRYKRDVLPFLRYLAEPPVKHAPYPSGVDAHFARCWIGIRIKAFHSPTGTLAFTTDIRNIWDVFGIRKYSDLQKLNRGHLSMILYVLQEKKMCDSGGYYNHIQWCIRNGIISNRFNPRAIPPDYNSFTTNMLHALCALYLCCLGRDMSGLNMAAATDETRCPWLNPGPDYTTATGV